MHWTCTCNDVTHESLSTALWHRAYCRWYDHHYGGRPLRAAVWGWIADRLVGRVRTA